MSRMYVCLSILPMQAEENGPSIHTYMDPCRLFFGRFEMYVAFSSPCVVEMGYVCRFDQFLRENEHTYIHPHKQTYNSSIAFFDTSKLEFHVCLPMPAVEIYIHT